MDRKALPFLNALAKLLKATISFVMFARPFLWNNSASTGEILRKFDICEFFRKSLQDIQV
jgi:hypothetical protein